MIAQDDSTKNIVDAKCYLKIEKCTRSEGCSDPTHRDRSLTPNRQPKF